MGIDGALFAIRYRHVHPWIKYGVVAAGGNGGSLTLAPAETPVALVMAPPSAVLSTRAVYSFTGFPGQPDCHLYLHHDGYPTGAAWRFARTLQAGADLDTFALAFLSNQPKAEPLASPEQAADAGCRGPIPPASRSARGSGPG